MKTHKVLDLVYTIEEGQDCFDGTRQECEDFVALQPNNFMYKVVPMTKEEIDLHPDNKQIKVVGSIDLSKFEKPIKLVTPIYGKSVKVVDLKGFSKEQKDEAMEAIGKSMESEALKPRRSAIMLSKPKLEIKKKIQEPKLLVIYSKPKSELGDPEPEEVNKAFNLIKEIEKTEKGLNFLNHIARVFNPYGFNHMCKVLDDGDVCCITNKKIAGLLPLSKKLAEVTPIIFTAHKILGELTQQEIDERNQRFSEMPEEYKVQRIGYFSLKSDKKISTAGFLALKYYLLEDTTRLLKFEVKPPSIEEVLGITKETPDEYRERQRKSKLTRPDTSTFGLDEKSLTKLQALKDKMQ